MQIEVEIMEDPRAAKSYMKFPGRNHFRYHVPQGGYVKNNRNHEQDLVGELNYHLRRSGNPEIDYYSVKRELSKLEPGRKVSFNIKQDNN